MMMKMQAHSIAPRSWSRIRVLMVLVVVAFGLGSVGARAAASESGFMALDAGLAHFVEGRLGEAIRRWAVGSDSGARARVHATEAVFATHAMSLGSPAAAHLIGIDGNAPNLRIVYLRLDHANGPLFGRFVLRRFDAGWSVDLIQASTDEESVIPPVVAEFGQPRWTPPLRAN